jgi:hypothetical protein
MKIAFLNFWDNVNNHPWFLNYIRKNISPDTLTVKYTENPDILFCSVAGKINKVDKVNANIKVFICGENPDRFPPYNDLNLLKNTFDIFLGFWNTDMSNMVSRFPIWLIYFPFYNFDFDNNNMITYFSKQRKENIKKNKSIFATCISRHDYKGVRTILYNQMSKHGKVFCPSKFKKNTENIGPTAKDKIEYISTGKFHICPENSFFPKYCTEKIFHALLAGTVPIYWGDDYPEKEILKRECCKLINLNNVVITDQQVQYIIKNFNKYLFQNVFINSGKYVIHHYYQSFKRQIQMLLHPTVQEIHGISYTSRTFQNRKHEIEKTSNDSKYFNLFRCYTENDISDDFKSKYKMLWNNNRGGGFWIWKPYIVYKHLQQMKENDILVYFDSGCELSTTKSARNRFRKYVQMINDHWTGFLRFSLGHPEKNYTNTKTKKYFQKYFNDYDTNIENENQLVGGILFIRKNRFAMDFFKGVLDILDDDPLLFSDKYTTKDENHRHDQSISSMLYKSMGGSLIIPDETYPVNKEYPINASRLK